MIYLRIGDTDDSSVRIVDEDKLCFLVLNTSRGTEGLRTISKRMLEEFIDYETKYPNNSAQNAREALSGKTDLDPFEYGYFSTFWKLAKLNKEVSVQRQKINLPLQQIFYGAPGTGKSRGIKDQESKFDEVIRTTFHPDTDYSTFVGAYKPVVENVDVKVVPVVLNNGASFDQNNGTYKEKKITYKFVKQSFLKAYISAWKGLKSDKKVLLDIEEINRGNCAQIFGDIFQLLDREVEGNMVGYSTYPIEADEDIANLLNEEFKNSDIDLAYIKDGSKLLLPPNLYIWATMNTSDQSLFPIDSAFKRRWDWVYIPIKYDNDWKIVIGGTQYSWVSFQEEVNNRIKDATDGSEDKQMGDYFVNVNHNDGIIDEDLLLNKIVFYLWNDVCKDGEGDIFKIKNGDKTENISFSQFFNDDKTTYLQQWMDYLEVDLFYEKNKAFGDNQGVINNNDGINKESGKDYTKYSINGVGKYSKKHLATELLREYLKNNPTQSVDDVVTLWQKTFGNIVSHFIETQSDFDQRKDKDPRVNIVPCQGTKIYVSYNGWGGEPIINELISRIPSEWNLKVEAIKPE